MPASDSDAADLSQSPAGSTPTGSSSPGDLSLPEALLLLALGDEEGSVDIDHTTELPFGLAASVLLTLAARERVRHEDDLWKVSDDTPTGDPALDPALHAMAASDEPRGTMHWLRTLPDAGDEDLKNRLLHHLVEKGVLEKKEKHFLGVFSYHRYPTEDPDPERRVREQVRRVVLEEESPDDRTLALIALMDACNLTDEVFDADERKEARDRLDELTEEQRVAHAVSAVADETAAAVLTATTAATVAATSPL